MTHRYSDDDYIRHVGELHTRTRNTLSRAGITTMGDLRKFVADGGDPQDLRGIGGLGYASIMALLGRA